MLVDDNKEFLEPKLGLILKYNSAQEQYWDASTPENLARSLGEIIKNRIEQDAYEFKPEIKNVDTVIKAYLDFEKNIDIFSDEKMDTSKWYELDSFKTISRQIGLGDIIAYISASEDKNTMFNAFLLFACLEKAPASYSWIKENFGSYEVIAQMLKVQPSLSSEYAQELLDKLEHSEPENIKQAWRLLLSENTNYPIVELLQVLSPQNAY